MINGNRLKELRLKKELTQEQLGDLVGVKKVSISGYEKGKKTPTVETLLCLMGILGVSADYLLGTDKVLKIVDSEEEKYETLTNNEFIFINELRRNELIYNMLIAQDPKRGSNYLKKKIG